MEKANIEVDIYRENTNTKCDEAKSSQNLKVHAPQQEKPCHNYIKTTRSNEDSTQQKINKERKFKKQMKRIQGLP